MENITGNEINLFDGDAGRLFYDDSEKVGNGYNVMHIFSKNGDDLIVNLIAGHGGLGEFYGNKINIYGYADLTLAKLYGATLFDDSTREHLPNFGTNNALNIYGLKKYFCGRVDGV